VKEFIKSIDPRMIFGFLVLIVITVLAFTIALGHVHQEASYGLEIILGSLSTLAGGFCQWAFSNTKNPDKP
jgi:hypothetical protein